MAKLRRDRISRDHLAEHWESVASKDGDSRQGLHGFERYYEVSCTGRLYSLRQRKYIKPVRSSHGRRLLLFQIDKLTFHMSIGYAVASSFFSTHQREEILAELKGMIGHPTTFNQYTTRVEQLPRLASEHGVVVNAIKWLLGEIKDSIRPGWISTPTERPTIVSTHEGLATDEVDPRSALLEGRMHIVAVNSYERSRAARAQCIDYWGYSCSVCKQSLEAVYGDVASGFIHVHHLTPLASIGEAYEVDPIRDLRPVCPNCHAIIHRTDPPLTIESLRQRLATATHVHPRARAG